MSGEDRRVEELSEDSGGKKKKEMSPKAKGILLVVILCILGYIFLYDGDGKLSLGNLKGFITSTPEENMMAMFTGMKDIEELNHNDGYVDPVYDKNNIYEEERAFKQVEKQYYLYIYTGHPIDDKFNAWVLQHQESYPVYKLEERQLQSEERLKVMRSGEGTPIIFLIREDGMGSKDIVNYVEDVNELEELEGYWE